MADQNLAQLSDQEKNTAPIPPIDTLDTRIHTSSHLTRIDSVASHSVRKSGKRIKQGRAKEPLTTQSFEASARDYTHDQQSHNKTNVITSQSNATNRSGPSDQTSSEVKKSVKLQTRKQSIAIAPSIQADMSSARLFIASLGNPPPYSSTRHSAGHIILKYLQSSLSLPHFQNYKPFANGLTSLGADVGRPEYTLWQSPSLMNVSGVALLKAYRTFLSTAQETINDPLPGLVILYDEMESSPGQLRLRRGATSAKGHNGLKSVQQSLQSAGLMDKLGDRFVKIGVGIGRPPGGSRMSEDVSQYVLGQITGAERQSIDAKVPELVKLLEAEMTRMSK